TSGEVTATIPVGPPAGRDGLDSMAALDGGLWVAGLQLERIDPATNRVVRRINHTCGAVTAGAGALWTVDLADAVSRITPSPMGRRRGADESRIERSCGPV